MVGGTAFAADFLAAVIRRWYRERVETFQWVGLACHDLTTVGGKIDRSYRLRRRD
jgi:hypothetical protein